MAFNYEEAEARAVESAKAAAKEVRRKVEVYDRLEAAARAVVAQWSTCYPLRRADPCGHCSRCALREALEQADGQ